MRPPAMIIADHPALDFLNTIGAPKGEEIEWLENGADLCAWLDDVGLAEAGSLAETAPDKIAVQARALREQFRRYMNDGDPAIFDQVNSILAKEHSHLELLQTGEVPQLRRVWRMEKPEDLLVPIAIAIAELLAEDAPERVRQCNGPTCTMWFKDISKNNKRRWCSMAVCGNRAKAAAHRAKLKSE
ncbi:CGNR zinc finger domain-containing protein [Actibacterium atlanticum]|nr:ABATE domain-containing protein [Actibacterium atlanticum]